MPISLTPFSDGTLCHGYSWTIQDTKQLASNVAYVALGHSRHVAKILAGINAAPPPTTQSVCENAIALLTVRPAADPWHRDGWLFQSLSWMAAYSANPNAPLRGPHMILAHKGFDGLQLELDSATGLVTAAVIFEDKATDHPRDTIRDQVWPDFASLEAGDRENVLNAEVSTLLATCNGIDVDRAIESIIWHRVRRYRVSITVDDAHTSPAGRQRLFHGFDAVAAGPIERRRGEVFRIEHLRSWMAALANDAIQAIKVIQNDV